jgi:hypothetical protein
MADEPWDQVQRHVADFVQRAAAASEVACEAAIQQRRLLAALRDVPKCPVHGDDPAVSACSCMIVDAWKTFQDEHG